MTIELVIYAECDCCGNSKFRHSNKQGEFRATSTPLTLLEARQTLRQEGWKFVAEFGEPPAFERVYTAICKKCVLKQKLTEEEATNAV